MANKTTCLLKCYVVSCQKQQIPKFSKRKFTFIFSYLYFFRLYSLFLDKIQKNDFLKLTLEKSTRKQTKKQNIFTLQTFYTLAQGLYLFAIIFQKTKKN